MTAVTTTTLLVFALAFGLYDCQHLTRISCENIRRSCTGDLYALVYEYRENPSRIDVDFGCGVLDQAKTCMGSCTNIVMATSETIRPIQYLCEPSRRDDVKGLLSLPCLEHSTVTEKYSEFSRYFIHCLMYPRVTRTGGEEQRDRCRQTEDMFRCLHGAITLSCGNSAASIYVGMLRYSVQHPDEC